MAVWRGAAVPDGRCPFIRSLEGIFCQSKDHVLCHIHIKLMLVYRAAASAPPQGTNKQVDSSFPTFLLQQLCQHPAQHLPCFKNNNKGSMCRCCGETLRVVILFFTVNETSEGLKILTCYRAHITWVVQPFHRVLCFQG